ncbi:MAG TPA: response regulator [Blastocatellia bacterium]|nr:response regulator [Blastocatellia bacterium]
MSFRVYSFSVLALEEREIFGEGLSAGDAGIVVATKGRRDSVDKQLRAYGLDTAAANARGQYISLDASETLSMFMVDGAPEPKRFDEIIGGMVAVLWEEGKHQAAIDLEKLWNDLQDNRDFWLFCAYPINGFGGRAMAGPLTGVCAEHSRVIPAESYTTLSDPDNRLRTIVELQQKAKALEAEVAERKQAEERLRALKEELEDLLVREQMARSEAESANRMKDEFLATVSHELRTPLNAIIGWSHMLTKTSLDEATMARAIETIERNAKSQAQLVEDILDVSRVITGKLRLNIGPVDVAAVINAAIDSVQLAADSKAIHLEVTLDPSARHISGDSGRLQQVVWNLLSNAEGAAERLDPAPSLDGLRVLVVDDDKDSLQLLNVMLNEHGACVHAAASVAEGIEALEWHKPDVVVSDLAMPGQDGYALIAKVKALEAERGKRIPAVALTAYVRVEDRARALAAGFNMFVPKPVQPGELLTAIANFSETGGGYSPAEAD